VATLSAYLATRAAITSAIQADDAAPVFVRLASGSWLRLRDDVPATRGGCPVERPCPHVNCEQHLYAVTGSERPGRRVAGRTPSSTLRTVYRQANPPPSCTLDVADATRETGDVLPIDKVGEYLGIKASKVHEDLASALKKLRAQGMALEDLMMGER